MKANIRESGLLYAELSYILQGCFFDIRKQYGPGQKEIIYHRLLEEKLLSKRVKFEREKRIEIYSQDTGSVIGIYQPDFVVDDQILIEVKSSRFTTKQDEKQLYFYLRNSKYELGYLVNFSTPRLNMKRIVYSNSRKPFLRVD
jgi:GxxExxY protein